MTKAKKTKSKKLKPRKEKTVDEFFDLPPKQREFVRRYLIHRNASRAMREAGYTSKNPDVDASKLLVNPSIQEIIAFFEKKAQEKFELTHEKIIDELIAIAFGNAGKVMDWTETDLRLVHKGDLTEKEMAFIDSISVEDTKYGKTISMTTLAGQKAKALEILGKHVGLFGKASNGGSGSSEEIRKNAIKRIQDYLEKRSRDGD